MSSAIDFAVRGIAGGTQRGQVSGPDQGSFIQMAPGESLSLNLSPGSVIGYTRDGMDLVIELADGRTITLADWFQPEGAPPNRLYLSTDGAITEVALTDPGDGFLTASFIPSASSGKWSPLDDLTFYDSDPVLAYAGTGQDDPAGMGLFVPALLGAGGAGLGTAALVGGGVLAASTLLGGDGGGGGGGSTGGGGGGGDGGGGGPTTPTYTRGVDGVGSSTTITSNTANPAITVTGSGIPGDSVNVTIGNQSQTTTVGPNGTWTAGFTGPTLPADGTHTATATFTGSGSTATLTGPGFIIDMTPPDLRTTTGFQSNGDVENLAEHADGVTLKGTTEPGATVNVTVGVPGTPGAITRPAIVNPDGTWEITFTPQEIPGGERSQTVTVTAADRLGNTRTLTETVVLDTVPPPLGLNAVAGENVVNRAESLQPILVTGTATPNTSVTLTIEGIPGTVTRTANADGVWSHELAAGTFTDGTYTRQITVTTRDAADNPTTVTRTLNIDTQMSVAIDARPFAVDNVVNMSESQGALTLTGTAPRDATRVEVAWLGQPVPATLNSDGTWSVSFPAGTATRTQDSTLTVTAWDAAGNRAETTRPIRIDLETALTLTPEPVGADRMLSGPEQSAGITVGGTGEAGAQVFLSLNNTPYGPIPVSNTGTWTHTFTSANLVGLSHGSQVTLTAYSVDAAGNQSTTETRSFAVDTQVGNFTFAAPDLMGTVNDGPRDAHVLNAVERSAGLPIQGTVEPGATVTIRVAETGWTTTIPAAQTANGSWSLPLPAAALPQGANAQATIIATATDSLGNTANAQQTIAIDTVVANFNAADIRLGTGTDNILNAREHAAGLRVEGKAEADSTITVTLGNHSHTATANSNGDWFVNFTSNQIPTGERTGIPVSVTATDTAGNTSGPFQKTFDVDTIAPNTPTVIEASDIGTGLRGITTTPTPDQYSFFRLNPTGPATEIAAEETFDTRFNEDRFTFLNGQTVPDGSYLVINTRDLAGNEVNTLFINNTTTGGGIDLNRTGFERFDLNAIDLTRAPDARLTITEEQLLSLTGPDKTLLIKGGPDDVVTLQNVTNVQNDQTINGAVYDIYTLGNSGVRILLEDDVSRTPTI